MKIWPNLVRIAVPDIFDTVRQAFLGTLDMLSSPAQSTKENISQNLVIY